MVDENRQRYPSFFAWAEENSPALVDVHFSLPESGAPTGFRAVVSRRPESSLPSYALRGYRAEWEVRDAVGALFAQGSREIEEIGSPRTVEYNWPESKSQGYRLTFRLVRPTGFTAFERTVDWWDGLSGGDLVNDMSRRGYVVK